MSNEQAQKWVKFKVSAKLEFYFQKSEILKKLFLSSKGIVCDGLLNGLICVPQYISHPLCNFG